MRRKEMDMKKFLSFILVFAMTISLCSAAFAAEPEVYVMEAEVGSATDIENAKDAYTSLSPKAKSIFDNALASDFELLQFHMTYVDPNYNIKYDLGHRFRSMAVSAANPMAIINAEFAAINLPIEVMYALKAMAAGMVAAISDGPLPVGDILLAAATVSAAVVIAANWNAVAPKWNSVVNAFKKAFSASAVNVTNAFQSLLKNVQGTIAKQPSVTVSGKIVTINGVRYNCTTKADSLTKNNNKIKNTFQRYFTKITCM